MSKDKLEKISNGSLATLAPVQKAANHTIEALEHLKDDSLTARKKMADATESLADAIRPPKHHRVRKMFLLVAFASLVGFAVKQRAQIVAMVRKRFESESAVEETGRKAKAAASTAKNWSE